MKNNKYKIIFYKIIYKNIIKMNKKELILAKLENLKKNYQQNEDKKWNLKALVTAINSIKKYDGIILSGDQLRNELKGVGEKISKRIDEILETGNLSELDNIDIENNNLNNLLLITGVGLVRAKKWLSMGINNIEELKEAIKNKKIKSTHHIDVGIKYYYDFQQKIPRSNINIIKELLNNFIKKVDKNLVFEICGSYRRGALESGDIDVLISNPNYVNNINDQNYLKKIVKILTKNNLIIDNLTSEGNTKFMGVCKIDESPYAYRIDIRVVNYENYFAALIYFTGSKNFNVYLRNKALEHNYSLNEYSLTNMTNGEIKILNSEDEIFQLFNIPYLKPTERNNE
jgi:DNA polymerase beta